MDKSKYQAYLIDSQLDRKVDFDSIVKYINDVLGYEIIEMGDKSKNIIDNLRIQEYALPKDAFLYYSNDFKIIFLKTNSDKQAQFILLAHELGHILLDHDTVNNFVRKEDPIQNKEANEFVFYLTHIDNKGRREFKREQRKRQKANVPSRHAYRRYIIAGAASLVLLCAFAGVYALSPVLVQKAGMVNNSWQPQTVMNLPPAPSIEAEGQAIATGTPTRRPMEAYATQETDKPTAKSTTAPASVPTVPETTPAATTKPTDKPKSTPLDVMSIPEPTPQPKVYPAAGNVFISPGEVYYHTHLCVYLKSCPSYQEVSKEEAAADGKTLCRACQAGK